MRILLVEDNRDFAKEVDKSVRNIPGCDLRWTDSRDGALALLGEESFDLVLLDRKIPTKSNNLDDSVAHGWSVFAMVRDESPGTSVWFLTGSEDADFAAELANEHAKTAVIHGITPAENLYRVFWKKNLSTCILAIRTFAAHVEITDAIAILFVKPVDLSSDEQRALRLFTKMFRGASVEVTPLTGGLSGVPVLKLTIKSAGNALLVTAVAKVDKTASVNDEKQRYDADVLRLTQGGYPTLSRAIEAGAAKFSGLLYAMVGHAVESLFQKLEADPIQAAGSTLQLLAVEAPWYAGKTQALRTVGNIRNRLVSDVSLGGFRDELPEFDFAGLERVEIQVFTCCQHGDLHCANVLFTGPQPVIIDFGDVGTSFAAVDPVTLELSTIFHTQAGPIRKGWPSVAEISAWFDLEVFVENCPFPDFIRACRGWAIKAAATPAEIAAVAYGYSVRQLGYPDTDHDLARALILACRDQLAP